MGSDPSPPEDRVSPAVAAENVLSTGSYTSRARRTPPVSDEKEEEEQKAVHLTQRHIHSHSSGASGGRRLKSIHIIPAAADEREQPILRTFTQSMLDPPDSEDAAPLHARTPNAQHPLTEPHSQRQAQQAHQAPPRPRKRLRWVRSPRRAARRAER